MKLLTGQTEALRFPHNETVVAEMTFENPALPPKLVSTFLVNKSENINRQQY